MAHALLTRRMQFDARHRFWHAEWTEAENSRVFGSAASAEYHAHTYSCDVTVSGTPDSKSGMLIDLAEFDRLLSREVRDRFHGKVINEQVGEFADGRMAPTGENLARFIFDRLQAGLPRGVALVEVSVAEDDTLKAAYRAQ